jgi:hypothetical protein
MADRLVILPSPQRAIALAPVVEEVSGEEKSFFCLNLATGTPA